MIRAALVAGAVGAVHMVLAYEAISVAVSVAGGGPPAGKPPRTRNYDEVTDLVAKRVRATSGRISGKRLLPALLRLIDAHRGVPGCRARIAVGTSALLYRRLTNGRCGLPSHGQPAAQGTGAGGRRSGFPMPGIERASSPAFAIIWSRVSNGVPASGRVRS